jgi:hypothetical protein
MQPDAALEVLAVVLREVAQGSPEEAEESMQVPGPRVFPVPRLGVRNAPTIRVPSGRFPVHLLR